MFTKRIKINYNIISARITVVLSHNVWLIYSPHYHNYLTNKVNVFYEPSGAAEIVTLKIKESESITEGLFVMPAIIMLIVSGFL